MKRTLKNKVRFSIWEGAKELVPKGHILSYRETPQLIYSLRLHRRRYSNILLGNTSFL